MRTIAKSLNILLVLFMTLCILNPALVSGAGWSSSTKHADPDFDRASQAIKAKEYDRAIEYLNNVVAKDDRNADAYNLLGYSERMRGNLDAAFKYYERALAIDPKHRGAHEYVGETYLLANNLPKAEEHLAALDKLCFFSCEEYRDLKAAIADYKEKHQH
jgi:tetratricopeptide (TPR) repeat protein